MTSPLQAADVIRRYCRMGEKAAASLGWTESADCFCGDNEVVDDPLWSYAYSEAVLEFIEKAIESAVIEALETP